MSGLWPAGADGLRGAPGAPRADGDRSMIVSRIKKLEAAASAMLSQVTHCNSCEDGQVARVVSVTVRDGIQTISSGPESLYDAEGRCRYCGRRAGLDREIHLAPVH